MGSSALVAHTTLSEDESVVAENEIYRYITLLSNDESVLLSPYGIFNNLLSYFKKISTSKNRVKIMQHLFLNIAESPRVIVDLTEIPEQSVYRELKRLEKDGIIETVIGTSYNWRRPGQASSIVAIPIYDNDHIINAREREKVRVEPASKFINELYRITLDDFIQPRDYKKGINIREQLYPFIKRQCSGHTIPDILFFTDGVAERLQKAGVPIWRNL